MTANREHNKGRIKDPALELYVVEKHDTMIWIDSQNNAQGINTSIIVYLRSELPSIFSFSFTGA